MKLIRLFFRGFDRVLVVMSVIHCLAAAALAFNPNAHIAVAILIPLSWFTFFFRFSIIHHRDVWPYDPADRPLESLLLITPFLLASALVLIALRRMPDGIAGWVVLAWLLLSIGLLVSHGFIPSVVPRFVRRKWWCYRSLTQRIEAIVRRSVGSRNLNNWKEDVITDEIVRRLSLELKKIRLSDVNIDSKSWKLGGKPESKFGDICLWVKIQYKDGCIIEGVAFLEAKRIYPNGEFTAIKGTQFQRIYRNAPHAQLLLYDNRYIEHDKHILNHNWLPYPGYWMYTSAVTLPINIAETTAFNDETLYRFAIPLSHQIVDRYFNGLDLEFTDDAKRIARGLSDLPEIGRPAFIVMTAVGRDGAPPPKMPELGIEGFEPL